MQRLALICAWIIAHTTCVCGAETPPAESAPRYENGTTTRWRFGATATGQGGVVRGLVITTPLPTDWPEQTVKITEEKPKGGAKISFRTVDGCKQLVITVPLLSGTDVAEATVLCEVAKRKTLAPKTTSELVVPKSPPKEMQRYLTPSPGIESTHPKIRELAASLLVDDKKSAWQQAEALYDGARAKIKYIDSPFKGALTALNDGTGDCEELSSLMIALCRASKIPARTVWVPHHCYAEFYLEDGAGRGAWYPCQPAGNKVFGSMNEERMILQKGDNFRVPEQKETQRYLMQTVKGSAVKGAANPLVKFIQEQVKE